MDLQVPSSTSRLVGGRVLRLVEGDITALAEDAIVNPANARLVLGAGVAGAIARRAGPGIQRECDGIGGCPVGGAVLTGGGDLPARHVIHAVGPRMGDGDEEAKLGSAVGTALEVAARHALSRVALPAISTGVFGFPLEECARISIARAKEHLGGDTSVEALTFCLFGAAALEAFRAELDRQVPHPAEVVARAGALLLDFDGTLADSEEAHRAAYGAAFAPYGHALDRGEYLRHWTDLGEGARGEVVRHGLHGVDLAALEAEKARRFSRACGAGGIRLYADAEAALAFARGLGRPAAIASNTAEADVRAVLRGAGVEDPGIPVVGGRPGLGGKPAPDIFLEAARVLGVSPSECAVVEDTRKGLRAARAAGMVPIAVRRPHNVGRPFPEAEAELPGLAGLARDGG